MAKAKAVTIYGIKNCDTMKKARSWLDARGVVYAFHDYKAAGIERGMLEAWVREVSWETLLNRAGTHVPQIGLERQERTDRKEGRHADARSAIDDQTARARRGWQVARRVQAGSLRKGIWYAVADFVGACAKDSPALDRAGCGEPMRSPARYGLPAA